MDSIIQTCLINKIDLVKDKELDQVIEKIKKQNLK